MKISLITVTFNAQEFIHECVQSVLAQTYPNVEHIIVDGNSTDKTLCIVNNFKSAVTRIISEPDKGIFDAMNKGIALATGDIVGILNADDFFPNPYVLEKIAAEFEAADTQVVYGDVWFIDRKFPHKVVRKWISEKFTPNLFQWGWMPAHPTFYAKRELFSRFGDYDVSYRSAADYELMLRFIHTFGAKATYLNELLVVMRFGGTSSNSLRTILTANWNCLKAMRLNGLAWPLLSFIMKPLRKIGQYFCRPEYFILSRPGRSELLTGADVFEALPAARKNRVPALK